MRLERRTALGQPARASAFAPSLRLLCSALATSRARWPSLSLLSLSSSLLQFPAALLRALLSITSGVMGRESACQDDSA